MKLRFGDFALDTRLRLLTRDGVEVPVEPLVFDCLELLARRPGALVRTNELRSRLWPDVRVGEGAARRVINAARRALGDTGDAQALIRTRKGQGYNFMAAVSVEHDESGIDGYDPVRPWPFVGRDSELAVLGRWLGRDARGGMCLVSGEAGAGKSSLLTRISQERAPHRTWLWGRCHPAPEQPAFWPFREIARQLLADRELREHTLRLARGAECVGSAIAELALEDLRPARAEDSAQSRFEACEAWAGMLAALAAVRPLHLVLEDVHWADEGSVAMLASLSRATRSAPLHVFATYRGEGLHEARPLSQLLARLSGREGVLDIHLRGLSQEALETLLAELELPGVRPPLAAELLRLTGGNALFVHELVRHALATSSAIGDSLPASFGHIVADRVRLLSERARELLDMAAVLGPEFDMELLSTVGECSSLTALLVELEPALRAGLLAIASERSDRLAFRHALLRDAHVEGLSLERRQAYHLAAVRALRAQPTAAGSAMLASHAFGAGSAVPRAERQRLCQQAGEEAFARSEYDRAATYLGRAVELRSPQAVSVETAALALAWAKARWHADHPERELRSAVLFAAECARRAGEPQLLAQAAILYAVGDESLLDNRIAFTRPDAPALVEEAWHALLHAAFGKLEAMPPDLAHGLATVLALLHFDCWDRAALKRWMDVALAYAPADPVPARRSLLLGFRLLAPHADPRALLAELAEHVCQPQLDTRSRIEGRVVLMALSVTHAELGHYEHAMRDIELLVRPLTDAVHLGRLGERLSAYGAIPLLGSITLQVIRGQLREAAERLASLPALAERAGVVLTQRGHLNLLALWRWLATYQGQSRTLEPQLEQQLGAIPGADWFGVFLKLQFALARGELESATHCFKTLREHAFEPLLAGQRRRARLSVLTQIADACTQVGNAADAAILYERLRPQAGLVISDGLWICLGASDRALGALALQQDKFDEAEHHFRHALIVNARLGHQPEIVRTKLGLSLLCRHMGRNAEADELLACARSEAQAIGMAGAALELAGASRYT